MLREREASFRVLGLGVLGITLWLSGCSSPTQAPSAQVEEAKPVQAPPSGSIYGISIDSSKVVAIGSKVTGSHTILFPIGEGSLVMGEEGCLRGGKIVLDIAKLQVLDLEGEDRAKLEGHLKSTDFFEVEKYPNAVFEVTGCERGGRDTVFLAGNLTMRKITKNIRFPATVQFSQNALRANATFNINRQDWGIKYKGMPDNLIKDEVNITLNILATPKVQ
ncbi:MAG: YceI family protein [Bacteroidia bacterium]|nr:YceI family protein [Bacteroidia bacterium]MDW8134013.1 YceI family protein [Bacteroidia bacterium]